MLQDEIFGDWLRIFLYGSCHLFPYCDHRDAAWKTGNFSHDAFCSPPNVLSIGVLFQVSMALGNVGEITDLKLLIEVPK